MNIRRVWVATIAASTVLGVSACGAAGGGSGGSGEGLNTDAQDAAETAFEGSFGSPPAESPDPEPGQNIWVIQYSPQFIDLEQPGQLADAAEMMGWDVTLFDGQFNPDTMVSGLRQAIADGADGVILSVVDCAFVKAGLEDVKDAGIPIVAFEATDCDQTVDEDGTIVDTGEAALFDSVVTYDDPENADNQLTFLEFLQQVEGPYQALAMAAGTDGEAKVIKLKETDLPITLAIDRGFEDGLDEYCPDCEVVETVEFVATDLGTTLQDKVTQAITRHPDATAIYAPYDAVALDVAPAVMASGRKDGLYVVACEGTEPVVELIASDRGVDAGVGYPVRWEAWAALDNMNRLLAGEKPDGVGFPSGMGAQIFTADRNLPGDGERFDGPVDFESAYLESWGLE